MTTTLEKRPAVAAPLLSVTDLRVEFPTTKGRTFRAVNDVSFDIEQGTTLAIVGESGCGKTTLARALLHLNELSGGTVVFDGTNLAALPEKEFRAWRKDVQMVFQDPYGSLDPRMRVDDLVAEPLRVHRGMKKTERRAKALELLKLVSLDESVATRRPNQLSGGQRQRVGIARALALEPRLLVCDEPTSALDVSVQAQVLGLLTDIRERLGTTMMFISHSLGVVHEISDTVAIMYLGRIVESGPTTEIFANPAHPYTKALLHVIPDPTRGSGKERRAVLTGDLPSPADPPSGCAFRTRCPLAVEACSVSVPEFESVGADHRSACLRTAEVAGWTPLPRDQSVRREFSVTDAKNDASAEGA